MASARVPTLPTSVADLTPDWFSQVLGETVADVELESLDEGVGFVARTVRARLLPSADRDDRPTVIVKFAADGPARAVASSMGLYEREVRFYAEIAPDVGVTVPECWFAEIDLDSGLFAIVLADLAPARPGDQIAGATDDEVAAAVSTLARLHARWWGDSAITGSTWLPSQASLAAVTLEHAPELYPAFAEAWSGTLSDDELKLGEMVAWRLQPLVDAVDHPPFTLVHGDYRLDNLFFTASGDVAVIDWQLSFRGHSGAFDLALLFASSLTSDGRRRLMTPLTQLYLDELVSNGVTGFGDGDLRKALGAASGLLVARCPVAHQIPSANERAATMRADLFRGYWDIAQDVGLAELLN